MFHLLNIPLSFFICVVVVTAGCSCDPGAESVACKQRKTVKVLRFIFKGKSKNEKYARLLEEAGMVDLARVDSSIAVDMRYATSRNIVGKDLYRGFAACYLHPRAAYSLARAQRLIKERSPGYTIVVFDAVRPASVQQRLWDEAEVTPQQRQNFLSHPHDYSLHNYGMAVDCSLADSSGQLLDMATPFDFPGELAYPVLEDRLHQQGFLSDVQLANRRLLRQAMVAAGFITNKYEWWHFSACTRREAASSYARIDDFNSVIPAPPVADAIDFDSSKVVFMVQVAASVKKLSPRLFAMPVNEYQHEGMYKYAAGSFNEYVDAFLLKDSLCRSSVPGAFVVCFVGGQRVGK